MTETPSDLPPRVFPLRGPGRWAPLLRIYGVRRERAHVALDSERVRATFGWFRVQTPLRNIESYEITGPYRLWRALGLRVSLTDRGLTFGTSARGGVCLRFREPVKLVIHHPSLTLTVADLEGFAEALQERGITGVDKRT